MFAGPNAVNLKISLAHADMPSGGTGKEQVLETKPRVTVAGGNWHGEEDRLRTALAESGKVELLDLHPPGEVEDALSNGEVDIVICGDTYVGAGQDIEGWFKKLEAEGHKTIQKPNMIGDDWLDPFVSQLTDMMEQDESA